MTSRRLLIPLLLLSGLLISACALGQMVRQAGAPTQTAPAPTLEATLPDLDTAEPALPSSTPAPAPTATQEAPGLTLTSGTLANYRHRLVLTFSGQDSQGSATSSRMEVMVEVDQPHSASHRMARNEIQGQRPGSLDLYQTEQGVFLISSEATGGLIGCLKTPQQDAALPDQRPPAPADLIQNLVLGEKIGGGEKINGAITDHYQVSRVGISFGTVEKGSSEAWIDTQTGVVVRLSGWAEGAFSLGAGASYGRVEWQYNMNKAANAQIALPPDCQALADNDLPLPENSRNPRQSGAELSFEVQAKPGLVAAFYRTELLKLGWTIDTDAGGGSIFELDASKNGRGLKITVTALDQGAQVVILRK